MRIGDWLADRKTNELRRGDRVVRLEPRAMDLLMALATQAGAVVGREELFATVWPGMVVGDEALTQGITKLRRAFGDDARSPCYIETISKRGYRMKAAVRMEAEAPARKSPALLAAGGLLAAVVAVIALAWPRPEPQPTVAKRHAPAAEAVADFERAQLLFLARTPRANDEARVLYRRAIERDPQFARAYAGLAMTHAMETRLNGTPGSAASLARALELAESARLIDPDVAEVHWALGFVHAQARRHPQALESLQRAIELDPSFADAYALMGGILTYVGQPAKSIPLLRTAMRLERDAGYLYYLLLGRAYYFQGDHEQALINLREAALRNSVDLETRLYLAAALSATGDRAGAEWEVQEILSLEPGFSVAPWISRYPLASAVHRRQLHDGITMAGLR